MKKHRVTHENLDSDHSHQQFLAGGGDPMEAEMMQDLKTALLEQGRHISQLAQPIRQTVKKGARQAAKATHS